jgi:hypothetical protein
MNGVGIIYHGNAGAACYGPFPHVDAARAWIAARVPNDTAAIMSGEFSIVPHYAPEAWKVQP